MAQSPVNTQVLNALYNSISTIFNTEIKNTQNYYESMTMTPTVTGESTNYPFLDVFPQMRLWLGDKIINNVSYNNYRIANEDYETTIEVDRNFLEDDQLGMLKPRIQNTAVAVSRHYDNLANYLKNNAFTNPCWDGLSFYNSAHTLKKADGSTITISNTGTKALSCASLAAVEASLGAGFLSISQMVDNEGYNMGLVPDTLEVPPQLRTTAQLIVNADILSDLSPNPYKGSLKVIVNPGLTSATAWFLHVTSNPMKPFIIQVRKAPTVVSMTDPNSESVFMRKQFRFGVEARTGKGYGLYQLSYGSTGTT